MLLYTGTFQVKPCEMQPATWACTASHPTHLNQPSYTHPPRTMKLVNALCNVNCTHMVQHTAARTAMHHTLVANCGQNGCAKYHVYFSTYIWHALHMQMHFVSDFWNEISRAMHFISDIWNEIYRAMHFISDIWNEIHRNIDFISDIWNEMHGCMDFISDIWNEMHCPINAISDIWNEMHLH